MPLQIKPSVTNPTIADVYQLIDEGKLFLRPDFQRKFVWTHEHQEAFIDTILLMDSHFQRFTYVRVKLMCKSCAQRD